MARALMTSIFVTLACIAVLAAEASAEKPVAKAEQACNLVCPPCYKLVTNPDGSCACEIDQTINCICKIDPNCSCPPGLQGTRCNGNNSCVCVKK